MSARDTGAYVGTPVLSCVGGGAASGMSVVACHSRDGHTGAAAKRDLAGREGSRERVQTIIGQHPVAERSRAVRQTSGRLQGVRGRGATVGAMRLALPNKAFKLTKLSPAPSLERRERLGRGCRLVPAPARQGAGTASQLNASVRRT